MDVTIPNMSYLWTIPFESLLLLSIKVLLAYIFARSIQRASEYAVGSIFFRLHPYVSVGSLVTVDGFSGRIKKIGWQYIEVENDKLGFNTIPCSGWWKKNWVFDRTRSCSNEITPNGTDTANGD